MALLVTSKSFTSCRLGLQTHKTLNSSYPFRRVFCNQRSHGARAKQPITCRTKWVVPRCIRGSAVIGKWTIIAFTSPFAFLRKIKHKDEVLANIPKEVFDKELHSRKRKKRNIISRLFLVLFDSLRMTMRLVRLTLTFLPIFTMYPVTYLNDRLRLLWLHWLLWACQFSGPTFTKFGQWAGTRRDLFSASFCDLFSELHTKVKPHSWYCTCKKLRKAFGKNWTKIFVAVDRKPIGSGCIAQVHKGYMRSDMIPDETVIEEALDDSDDDADIDFSVGLEIIGFGQVMDSTIGSSDADPEFERSWRWWRQKGVPAPTPPPTDENESDNGNSTPTLNTTQWDPSKPENDVSLIPVAIKVLHPGVLRSVRRDIAIIKFVVHIAEWVVPGLHWLSLPECMGEFSELMMQQIDLRFESKCLEKFIANFADNPHIRFPRPIRPYCKRDVLVETFEDGELICKYLQNNKDDPPRVGLKEAIASYGLDALLQMVFVDNLVHGDLHPGNLLVQNASDFVREDEHRVMLVDVGDTVVMNVQPTDKPVRLVMLDVGICSSLSDSDLQNFKNVFTAIVIGEGEKVADLMLKHSTKNDCKDIGAFRRDLETIVMNTRKETIKLGKVNIAKLLLDVFQVLHQHHVKLESNFASIVLAMFVLEGIARSLDPEVDILERAKPILLF